MEKAPIQADIFPEFTPEALRRDIEVVLRDSRLSQHDSRSPRAERQAFVQEYIEQLDLNRRAAIQFGRERKYTPDKIALAATMYGCEMVRANLWINPQEKLRDLNTLRQSITWQNDAAEYILRTNQLPSRDARARLQAFWYNQNKLLDPFFKDATYESNLFRYQNGILRSVMVLHTLRTMNGWEAAPPPDPDDDAIHKIDAVAKSDKGINFVFQLKPQGEGEVDAAHPITLTPVLPDSMPDRSDDVLYPFWQGMTNFGRKYSIPSDRLVGVHAKIATHSLDHLTGLPTDSAALYLSNQVDALDMQLSARLDTSENAA